MNKPVRFRRAVALAAAYVVALQALLLPLSVAAGTGLPFSLCAAGRSIESPQQPAGHDGGCPCAAGCGMQCCLQTLAGPPQEMAVLGVTRTVAIAPALAIDPIIRIADRSPKVARAPPA